MLTIGNALEADPFLWKVNHHLVNWSPTWPWAYSGTVTRETSENPLCPCYSTETGMRYTGQTRTSAKKSARITATVSRWPTK